MSHKHAATAKKKLKNKAFSFPISNIHTDTDLGIQLCCSQTSGTAISPSRLERDYLQENVVIEQRRMASN